MVSGFQTGSSLWDLLSRPFPLPMICSTAQPSTPAQRPGKRMQRPVRLFPRRMCAQMWVEQSCPGMWELAGTAPQHNRPTEAGLSILGRWRSKHSGTQHRSPQEAVEKEVGGLSQSPH